MYEQVWTSRFRRDIRRCERQNKPLDKFKEIARLLSAGEFLPPQNCDHNLTGNYTNHRECHISPDWLLVYRINKDKKVIEFVRTGSHSDLF
ncbi:MAG: type II toxin-antitoxin system YafQ family toxin [Candidatus Pacebacteria bacterium]|nr:type II toxin-antitoxin system YafQ family toxin [Candidatus Paceibacterota bacterium]